MTETYDHHRISRNIVRLQTILNAYDSDDFKVMDLEIKLMMLECLNEMANKS